MRQVVVVCIFAGAMMTCPAGTHWGCGGFAASPVTAVKDVREPSPLDALLPGPAQGPVSRVEPPPVITDDELQERSRIADEARSLLLGYRAPAPDIHALEKLMTGYRTEKARTASGVWKLTVVYQSIPRLYHDLATIPDAIIAPVEKTLDAWSEAYPQSPSPHIYRASLMAHRAIAMLEDNLARSTYPGGEKGLRAKLEQARQYLVARKGVAATDPHWYALMIRILVRQGSPMDRVLEVMIEGAERFPDYHDTYFSATRAAGKLSAKPPKDIEAIANTAVQLSGPDLGNEMYARIYWVALVEVLPGNQKLYWSWPKMVSGMQAVARRYDAQWNIQQFALFACMMQDRATTKEMLAKTRGNPIPQVWGDSQVFDACEAWATTVPKRNDRKRPDVIFPR